jgi:hypothetical protein
MSKKRTNRKKHHILLRKTIKKGGLPPPSNDSRVIKQMNCNPIVKGKTIIKGSCFTNETIQKLKESYNKHHAENKITESNPVAIWKELQKRMSKCSKEDCWLNAITDAKEKQKLDNYLFAPDHPAEWKKDPNAWLSNYDIMNVLRQYEETYPNFRIIGPTPIDFDSKSPTGNCVWQELCDISLGHFMKKGKTKLSVVFNLSASDEPGSHWVSLFVDLEDKFIFFFDSAGDSIPKEINDLVEKVQNQYFEKMGTKLEYYDNKGINHQEGNTECGMYSLYFIITMLTGEVGNKQFSNYHEKIRFFKNKRRRITDKYVSYFRKIYFNS